MTDGAALHIYTSVLGIESFMEMSFFSPASASMMDTLQMTETFLAYDHDHDHVDAPRLITQKYKFDEPPRV